VVSGGRRRVFAWKGGKALPSNTYKPLVGPQMSEENINTGIQQLRDKVSPYRWYPTLQIGISYRF
jgi:hypothetical protein